MLKGSPNAEPILLYWGLALLSYSASEAYLAVLGFVSHAQNDPGQATLSVSGQLLSALRTVAFGSPIGSPIGSPFGSPIGSPIANMSGRSSLFGQALVEMLAQGVDKLSQVLVPPASNSKIWADTNDMSANYTDVSRTASICWVLTQRGSCSHTTPSRNTEL